MVAQNNRFISVREFQPIFAATVIDGVEVTKQDIEALRLELEQPQSDVMPFLKPIRNGVQVMNYVGVLQTQSGLTIEILPKLYNQSGEAGDKKELRQLFLTMLKTVRRLNGKTFNMTHLDVSKTNLLEVFISMFLSESDAVIKRGLKSDYVNVERNEKFLKGKLLVTQHIRKNNINQAYFYNAFDEYLIDIIENQLLKTTLEFLLKKSKDARNNRLIKEQLVHLNCVSTVSNPEQAFQKVKLGRTYGHYTQALEWCQLFLSGKSLTSFRGSTQAFAILFPMEKLFESYVATLVTQYLPEATVSSQDKAYALFDKTAETKASYHLRPDLVVRYKDKAQGTIIADTKWKILNEKGPSQADAYQMYAYHTRYCHKGEHVKKVVLIYPYTTAYQPNEFRSLIGESTELGARIQVRFIDLFSDNMAEQIIEMFNLNESLN
ncbi:McrC family protein [Vagococcus fessus]|uniref:Restriction endonuclease n=1 Tax=Vagococcus fessus TaxID=120370 RepID=A0A430ACH7_9ENTE|nr:McrC family protein [Vagococcus fessus]RSU04914.1 hypothetical protein CBF31_02515 [Vagococcus fessus]